MTQTTDCAECGKSFSFYPGLDGTKANKCMDCITGLSKAADCEHVWGRTVHMEKKCAKCGTYLDWEAT